MKIGGIKLFISSFIFIVYIYTIISTGKSGPTAFSGFNGAVRGEPVLAFWMVEPRSHGAEGHVWRDVASSRLHHAHSVLGEDTKPKEGGALDGRGANIRAPDNRLEKDSS